MKRNRIISMALAVGMIATSYSFSALAEDEKTSLAMTVETNNIIKTTDAEMYGISTDWSINSPLIKQPVATAAAEIDTAPNPQLVKGMNDYGFPLVRLGEGASRNFQWKAAIGPMADRADQTLWGTTNKVAAGPLESVNVFETLDSNAKFTVTLNVENDTAQSAADFAQFLLGGTDTEWGAKRAVYGHAAPVNVELFEIGNEVDHGDNTMTADTYIAKCKEFITAVKAVAPNVKFAVQTSTGAYGGAKYYLGTSSDNAEWRKWHQAILKDSELASQIDYIAVHTYFYAAEAGSVMENCVRLINEDVAAAGYSGKIKTFVSEYALWNKNYDGTAANTHDITAVTENSDVLSRMMWHPEVEKMTYHGINSSDWANIVNDTQNGRMYLNGIGNLLKLYKSYGVGDVLKTTLEEFETETQSDVTGVALRNSKGNINFIFTNKSATDKIITVNTGTDAYRIVNEMRIVSSRANATDDIAVGKNDIKVNSYTYADGALITQYTVPAYSVCAVETQNANTIEISESFTIEENFDIIKDGMLPEGWSAANGKTLAGVENGALVVEPVAGWTTAIVKIPNTENAQREALTIEADMTLISYNETTRSSGAQNRAGFAYMLEGDKISSTTPLAYNSYVNLTESCTSSAKSLYITNSDFVGEKTIKLKLEFTDGSSPTVYIGSDKFATAKGSDTAITGETQNIGGIGIMVNDAKVKFDNVKVSGTRIKKVNISGKDAIDASFKSETTYMSEDEVKANVKVTAIGVDGAEYDITDKSEITALTENGVCTVTVKYNGEVIKTLTANVMQQTERGFRFEENFDSVPSGSLPAGMKFIGSGTAAVQDGALNIIGKQGEWGSNVLLIDVAEISRYGLDMECDITRISSSINDAQAGFIYATELVDGKLASGKFSKVTAYTGRDNGQLCYSDGSISNDASSFTYNDGEKNLANGGTIKLRFKFTKNKELYVFVNGRQAAYSNKASSAIDSGYVGLYVLRDASVKIDNLVVSGTEKVYADPTSSITKASSNAADGKLAVSVTANSAGLSEKSADLIAAIYEKASGRLVSVSERKAWNIESYPNYRTTLELNDISDYSADKYTVKVFALNSVGSLKPLVNNIVF